MQSSIFKRKGSKVRAAILASSTLLLSQTAYSQLLEEIVVTYQGRAGTHVECAQSDCWYKPEFRNW